MLVGQQVGPFEIEQELGSGAMGTVYRAKYDKGDRVVPIALKVVALGLLGNEGAMARFEREANILKQLRHPHIVRLIATGSWRKTPFIAMEYVEGEALDRALSRRGKLGWEEVVAYAKQLCLALQYAHEKGIIHRDLKPSNLMITPAGALKLADFGIAKDTDVTALTGMNSTIGTAAYMSPEQCKGDRNLTNKSDLYSLGVVLFELLSGRKPFSADSTVDMFLKHVNEPPPRLGKIVPDLPQKLESLVLQLLEKDKHDRPTDAAWVGRMLGDVEEDAFARKSAGLSVATSRKVDRARGPDAPLLDSADREAARALKGGKKKKKKKRPTLPFFQRPWVKAAGIAAVLVGMAVGVYLGVRPPSAETLAAAVDAARADPDARLAAAERYLAAHGNTPGEATDRVAAAFREEKVRQREGQLAKRFANPKWRDDPEGDDPEAYRAAMTAIQAEVGGNPKLAADVWDKVKARFPEEAALPFALDESKLAKARWGWLADKRKKDIDEARKELAALRAELHAKRTHEMPVAYDPTSARSLAARALRLDQFRDVEKAGREWDKVATLPERDPAQHVWFLVACEQRAALPKPPGDGAAERRRLIQAQLAAAEAKLATAKANPELIPIRTLCRDVADLYDDEADPTIAAFVAVAKQLLAKAAAAG